MARKRFTPEQVITMLREAEVLLSQSNPIGGGLPEAGDLRADLLPLEEGVRRDEGRPGQATHGYVESFFGKMRNELLNGEVLDTLDEAKVLVEAWRRVYNRIRPHSSLEFRPPAPEAHVFGTFTLGLVQC